MATNPLKNNQAPIKKGRGGKRKGAGRKPGSTNKIQGGEFLEAYKQIHGNDLVNDLAQDIYNARLRGDYEMVYKYQTAFARYIFSDVKEVDITTNGESLNAKFEFTQTELPDWSDIPITYSTREE